jgi:hypothetical protein
MEYSEFDSQTPTDLEFYFCDECGNTSYNVHSCLVCQKIMCDDCGINYCQSCQQTFCEECYQCCETYTSEPVVSLEEIQLLQQAEIEKLLECQKNIKTYTDLINEHILPEKNMSDNHNDKVKDDETFEDDGNCCYCKKEHKQ